MSRQAAGIAVSGALLAIAVIAIAAFLVRDREELRFTGDPGVDRVLNGFRKHDVRSLVEQVAYQTTPCSVEPRPDPITQLLPPRCPDGAPDGSAVEVFMTGDCGGAWVAPDGVLGAFAERLPAQSQVYAVLRMQEPFSFIVAQYRVVYGRPGEPEVPLSGHIALQDGKIVQLATWCGSVETQIAALESVGGEIIYLAPDFQPQALVRAAAARD